MSRLKILALMLPPCILFLLLAIPAQGRESKGVPKQVLRYCHVNSYLADCPV
jgi:hypothetical protein